MATRVASVPKDFGDLISQAEAASLRGVSRAAIGYLVTNGRLRSHKMFGRRLVFKSEVLAFEPGKPGPKASPSSIKRKRTKGSNKK